jgi:hypothetical protein
MKDLVKDFLRVGRFTPVAPYQRLGYVCAALLVVIGALHGAVLVDRGEARSPGGSRPCSGSPSASPWRP